MARKNSSKRNEDLDQASIAAKALKLKKDGVQPPEHPDGGRQSNEGSQSIPHTDQAPSGAFDAEGQRPVLERSRKVR
jgi:hypothetical protein